MFYRVVSHFGTRIVVLAIGTAFGCPGCGRESEKNQPGWSGPLDASSQRPYASQDAGTNGVPCTPRTTGARPHELGNYDYQSCNATNCHQNMIGGGWIYANPKGPPFLGGATITIYNIDGSIVSSVSGEDGFFQIEDEVKPPYKVCVSECPGANCSLTAHPNADCQTSNCHGKADQKIYVSNTHMAPTPADGGFGNCAPPTTIGPYTHTEPVFGNQACSSGGCHRAPKTVLQGGFLYDGPDSNNTIAEATITVTPSRGTPTTLVTGATGMFFVGTIGNDATPIALTPPYTVCVNKCSTTVCSATNGHTETSDCQSSGCHESPQKVYLR